MNADTLRTTTVAEHRDGAREVIATLPGEGPWSLHQNEIEAGLAELKTAVLAVKEANAGLLELMRRLLYKADQGSLEGTDALTSVLRH